MTRWDGNRVRPMLPLHAGAGTALFAAISALSVTAESPGFAPLMLLAMATGISASAVALWYGSRSGWLSSLLIAAAFLLGLARIMGAEIGAVFYPPEILGNTQFILAASFLWAGIACCFNLTTPSSAYFTVALSFAAFGLVGPETVELEVLMYFCVFCVAAIFVLGYGRRMEDRREVAPHVAARTRPLLLSAGVVFIVAMLCALVLGPTLYTVAPRLFVHLRGPATSLVSRLSAPTYAQVGAPAFMIGKGPINLSDRPVVIVRASSGRLWRGAVYDRYTGDGWDRANGRQWPGRSSGRPRVWITPWTPPRESRTMLRQDVEMLGAAQPCVIAAAEPVAVQVPRFAIPDLRGVTFDAYNCARFYSRSASQWRYTVWSATPDVTPAQLANTSTDYPDHIRQRYLSLPVRTMSVAKGVSERIVGEAQHPYDKARAIHHFLAENYTYTTNAPYIPPHRDAVVEFLTSERRGACDLFASAFVVLARAQGIPSRIATGFATGVYSQRARGFVVRESDAHAWAEIYFPEYGWVPFDPTVGASRDPRSLLVLLKIGAYGRFVVAALKRVAPFLLGGLLLAWVATSLFGLNFASVRRRLRPRTPSEALTAAYLKACRDFARRRCPRDDATAPGEFLAEVSQRFRKDRPAAVSGLQRLTDVFVRARYGSRPPGPEDVREAERALRRIHLALHGR